MIPKIIHYCWFGPNPIPDKEQKCIESWKKYFPDFEFKFWNENSFNVNNNEFTIQAYESKKFAFVSDYVRVKALYEYGGLYLDTDVEVIKPFDIFFKNEAFLGFENRRSIGTAVIACEKRNPIIGKMLDYYQKHSFVDSKGNLNIVTNVEVLTEILEKDGLVRENSNQVVGKFHIYARDYFYTKKISDTEFLITENTVSIHKMSASWLTDRQIKRGNNKFWINIIRPILQNGRKIGLKIIGEKNIHKLEVWIRNKLK